MKKLSQISPSVVPQWTPCEQCSNGWVEQRCQDTWCSLGKAHGPHSHAHRCACVKAHAQRVADALKARGKK